MFQSKPFIFAFSTFALCYGTSAHAEITAEEVWAEWQSMTQAMGQEVTAANVRETGNGLLVSEFTTTTNQQGAISTGSIDEVTITENGDGTVTVTFSDEYTITSSSEVQMGGGSAPKGGGAGSNGRLSQMIEVGLSISGLSTASLVVSGEPQDRLYAYDAPSLTLELTQIEGPSDAAEDISMSVTFAENTAEYRLIGDGNTPSEMAFSGNTGAMTGVVSAIENGMNISANFNLQQLSNEGEMDLASYASFLQMGFADAGENLAMRLQGGYASAGFQMRIIEGGTTMVLGGSNQGGTLNVALADGGMQLGQSSQNPSFQASGSGIPAPIAVSATSSELSLLIPVEAMPEPSDMAFRIDYQDLTLGDDLWNLFDPGNNIPRDPANFTLDLTGQVQMFQSLLNLDPDTIQSAPGELRSAQLNELAVSAAGVELGGTGQLSFAPGQIVPMPVGQIDLTATGLFALLDRLTAAGFLPAEQAAMARGVSAMFARPGAGPDTLESTIEFTPNGGITANGFPLQ